MNTYSPNILTKIASVLVLIFLICVIPYRTLGIDQHWPMLLVQATSLFVLISNYSKLHFSKLDLAFVLFISTLLFSFLWAENPSLIWPSVASWSTFYIVFKMFSLFPLDNKTENCGLKIITTCLALNIGFIIFAYLSFCLRDQIFPLGWQSLRELKIYAGHNSNYISSVVALSFPILIYATTKLRKFKIVLFTVIIFAMIIIYIFKSRAALILIAIQLLVLFVSTQQNLIQAHSKKLFWLAISVIGLFLMSNFMNLIPYHFNYSRSLSGIEDDRIQLWYSTWNMFMESPLLGIGAGNWIMELLKLDGSLWPAISGQEIYYSHPHNLALHLLAEAGIIGFALFFFFILRIILLAYSSYKKNNDLLQLTLLLVVLSYLFLASFYGIVYNHSDLYLKVPLGVFAAVLGFIVSGNIEHPKRSRINILNLIIGMSALCLTSFSFIKNQQYKKFKILGWQGKHQMAIDGYTSLYDENMTTLINKQPLNKEIALLLHKMNRKKEAIKYMKESLVDLPFWNDYLVLGELYEEGTAEREAAFLQAYSLNHTNVDIHCLLAEITIEKGDAAAANEWLRYFYSLNEQSRLLAKKEPQLSKEQRRNILINAGHMQEVRKFHKYEKKVRLIQARIDSLAAEKN